MDERSSQIEVGRREFVAGLVSRASDRINAGASRTLTGRLAEERPPRDPRHLTDTRTRVSTLLEFSLAYEMNQILEQDQSYFSISAVLWNIFPDLLIRDESRMPAVGLEIKALHTAAEEKSANFSTPLQIIRKDQDFVVILVWGWAGDDDAGVSIVYPHIHAVEVFDAWQLARIRDLGWLNNHRGRIKGFDLLSPLISASKTTFKAEEGNLGKLMRISLPESGYDDVPEIDEMRLEARRFHLFRDRILSLALRETFIDICLMEDADPSLSDALSQYPLTCSTFGRAVRGSGHSLIAIAGANREAWLRGSEGQAARNGTSAIWLGAKLNWVVFVKREGHWVQTAEGNKPDSDLDAIRQAFG